MATFRDTAGRTWTLSISIATVRRVRDRVQVDLLAPNLPALLADVLGDLVKLCDVLFVIVQPEADRLGVSDVDFGQALAGDALEEGAKAFLEAIRDFIPNPRDRARVGRLIEAMERKAEQFREAADRGVDELTRQLEQAEISGAPWPSSPASPESSPAP